MKEVYDEVNRLKERRIRKIQEIIKKFDTKKLLNELVTMRFDLYNSPSYGTNYFEENLSSLSSITEYLDILLAFTCKYPNLDSKYFNEQEVKDTFKIIEDIFFRLMHIDLLSIYLTEKKFFLNIGGKIPLDFSKNKQYYAYRLLSERTNADRQERHPSKNIEETFETFKTEFKEFNTLTKDIFNLSINDISDIHKKLFELVFFRKEKILSIKEFEDRFKVNGEYIKTLIVKSENININFEYNFGWQTPIVKFSDFYFINFVDIISSLHELDFRIINNRDIKKGFREEYKAKRSQLFVNEIIETLKSFGWSTRDQMKLKITKKIDLGDIDILARKWNYVLLIESKSGRPDNLSKTLSAPNLFYKRLPELNKEINKHFKRYEYISRNKRKYGFEDCVIIPMFITDYPEIISHYVKDMICLSLFEFKEWMSIVQTKNEILLTENFFREKYRSL